MNTFSHLRHLVAACLAMFIAAVTAVVVLPQNAVKKEQAAAFSFAKVPYFHRFTQADQHEFTPAGQENLQAWTDMVTLRSYRAAKDGAGLAAVANTVLSNYKANRAVVVKTNSTPRTNTKPAEHLIVVAFPQPKFIEAVFARFRMQNGNGTAVIYSHRMYGEKVGPAMSAWLEKNGPTIETDLMNWDATVKLPSAQEERR